MTIAQYARLLATARSPIIKLLRALLHALGVPLTDQQVYEFTIRLYRPMLAARDNNHRAALAYLATQQLPSGLLIPAPRDYPIAALSTAIKHVALDLRITGNPVTQETRANTQVIETARKALEGPVTRHAQEPAREIAQDIGENPEHENVGWARMLTGAYSCSFCAMMASRGPIYTSHETAIGRGGNPLDLYHTAHLNKNGKQVGGNCDCVAVPVVSFESWEGYAAFQHLENLWQDTGGKASGADARNAFRHEWDAQVVAGTTSKYLADSLKPRTAVA